MMKIPNTHFITVTLLSSQTLWKCDLNQGPGFSGFGSYISATQSVANSTIPMIKDAVPLMISKLQNTVVIKNAIATT